MSEFCRYCERSVSTTGELIEIKYFGGVCLDCAFQATQSATQILMTEIYGDMDVPDFIREHRSNG